MAWKDKHKGKADDGEQQVADAAVPGETELHTDPAEPPGQAEAKVANYLAAHPDVVRAAVPPLDVAAEQAKEKEAKDAAAKRAADGSPLPAVGSERVVTVEMKSKLPLPPGLAEPVLVGPDGDTGKRFLVSIKGCLSRPYAVLATDEAQALAIYKAHCGILAHDGLANVEEVDQDGKVVEKR